jgi:uncharacterized protein YgiM (DUF1202 family)
MKRTWVMSAMLLWTASALAETAYVSDKVYVDIRADAHYESPVAHRLLAGTKLEVLGQSGDFTRVRDAQGRLGWIENRELTRDLPAALRQAEVPKTRPTKRRLPRHRLISRSSWPRHGHSSPKPKRRWAKHKRPSSSRSRS